MLHGLFVRARARPVAEARAFPMLSRVNFPCSSTSAAAAGSRGQTRQPFRSTLFVPGGPADRDHRIPGVLQGCHPEQPLMSTVQSMGREAIPASHCEENGLQTTAAVIECPFLTRLLSTVENRFRADGLPRFPAPGSSFLGGWQHGFKGFDQNSGEYAREGSAVPVLLMQGGG